MATTTQGILGPVSGKIGPVVGFTWRGIAALRSYVIPANPNTPAQQATRSIFAQLVTLARQVLTGVIQPYWGKQAVSMSEFNAFLASNRPGQVDPLDYLAIKMTEGSLEGVPISSVEYSGSTADFSWSGTPSGNGQGTDKVLAIVYDSANNVAFTSDGQATRSQEVLSLPIGTGRQIQNLHAWLSVYRGAGPTLQLSNSGSSDVV